MLLENSGMLAARPFDLELGRFPRTAGQLLVDVLPENTVHSRLPTFAGTAEVLNDLGAVPNRDQHFLIL